jgi:hypothetical protein
MFMFYSSPIVADFGPSNVRERLAPPRLVLGHEIGGSAPARLFLAVDEAAATPFASFTMKHDASSSAPPLVRFSKRA